MTQQDPMPPRQRRPVAVRVEPLVAYARRGPRAGGLWYWQAGYHQGKRLISVPGLSAWATRDEMTRRLAARVSAQDWRVTEAPLMVAETVDHLLRLWLVAQRERREVGDLAASSYAAYLHHGRAMRPLLGTVLLDRLDVATIERARDAQLRQGLSPRTVALTLRLLRMAWVWGRERGHTPQRDLPRVAVRVDPTEFVYDHYTPTTAEAQRAIEQLAGWHRPAAELLWATGARVSEVIALTWGKVDLVQGHVVLRGKTGTRPWPLAPQLLEALRRARPGDADDEDRVLGPVASKEALLQALTRACRAAGVRRFTPHGLRRLGSTILIGERVDPRTYAALMGHSYQMGLRNYAQVQVASVRAAAGLLGRQAGKKVTGQVVHGPWTHDDADEEP